MVWVLRHCFEFKDRGFIKEDFDYFSMLFDPAYLPFKAKSDPRASVSASLVTEASAPECVELLLKKDSNDKAIHEFCLFNDCLELTLGQKSLN